jgi:cytochrome c-type biogenesis protein CcmH
VAPPGAPAAAVAGGDAPTAQGEPIRGRIVLAEELAGRVPPGAVLFLVARSGESGPPAAVKRVVDPRFPLDFEIGPGDSMMAGVPFAGPFRLTARVDADQNAATRNPGDLQGETASRVAPGTSGVELVIDQVL